MENTKSKHNLWMVTLPPPATATPFPKCTIMKNYKFPKILISLYTIFLAHIRAFNLNMDTTQDCTSIEEATTGIFADSHQFSTNNNAHYIFSLLTLLAILIDSGFILAREGYHYNRNAMKELFTHKIFPREFWYPGTVIMHIASVMSIVDFGLLLVQSMPARRFIIFVCTASEAAPVRVIQDGRVWNQKNAQRFAAFRQSSQKLIQFIQITVYCTAYPYWFYGLATNYRGEVRDYLFFVYLPFFLMYTAFGCIFTSFYIMLSANYMRIQQTFLKEKIDLLTDQIRKSSHPRRRHHSSKSIWRHFTATNIEILHFFKQLNAISKYWSPYLSVYFFGHISMEVFLIYAVLIHGSEYDLLMRSVFLYFMVEFMILMLAITAACSAIVRHNVQIYKTNVAFCYAYTRKYKPRLMYQLKMNQMIANYKGTRNGFRLVTNYIVDSRMFEAIVYFISTIFIKVIQ